MQQFNDTAHAAAHRAEGKEPYIDANVLNRMILIENSYKNKYIDCHNHAKSRRDISTNNKINTVGNGKIFELLWLFLIIVTFLFVVTDSVSAGETRAPVFNYVVGDYSDISAEGAIQSWNASSEFYFQQCESSGPNASCAKEVLKQNGIGTQALVNGVYTLYGLDKTTTYYGPDGSSTVQEYPNSTAIFYGQDCGTGTGFGGGNTVVSGTTQDGYPIYSFECIKPDQPPPLQCPAKGSPPSFGNPISLYDGTKIESFIDYSTADGLLELKRTFRGQHRGWMLSSSPKLLDIHSNVDADSGAFALGYFRRFNVTTGQSYSGYENVPMRLIRSSAEGEVDFVSDKGVLNISLASSVANPTFLTDVAGAQIVKLGAPTAEGAIWVRVINDDSEEYGADGRLRKLRKRDGRFVKYSYVNNQLSNMTDNFGRQINYRYGIDGMVDQVALPDGLFIRYAYQNKILTSVQYQDNSTVQFLYNEEGYAPANSAAFLLTGKVDENGKRIGLYTYDAAGRAVSTELAGGVGKYTFNFGGSYSEYTDPLGSTYTYYFSNTNGYAGISSTNQPAGSGCGSAASQYTYDANGNVTSSTDFNGVTTTYTYDLTRNLETSRVEAAGTPQARTVTTSWHASYRLPLKIAEPKLLTTLTYDGSGNLLTRKQQATTDASGVLGLAAPVTGVARSWSWTYNGIGQVLTATGPRTDVVDRTTYVYDSASGNLTSSSNAAGQVTTFNSYDANGRLTRMTDPNGVVTTLTYAPRGWLLSSTTQAGGISEATRYAYDAVGQLTSVTLPDASVVHYGYDDAHRLTSITDNLGNRIAYTLDNMGNRINETVSDPGGVLARQTSRSYDALNRLQQVTGGVQ